jgi:F420H(2)-dependent quinone reductase
MSMNDRDAVDTVMTHVHAKERDWARLEGEVKLMTKSQLEQVAEKGTTAGVEVEGSAIVVVTTRGVKSGEPRVYPLMRVEHEGKYALVGSLGGSPRNPTWFFNIKAHPTVQLQDGVMIRSYAARELQGEDRERWWQRALETYPTYGHYQSRCERAFPIFELTPVEADS